jgi:hypothetical protein
MSDRVTKGNYPAEPTEGVCRCGQRSPCPDSFSSCMGPSLHKNTWFANVRYNCVVHLQFDRRRHGANTYSGDMFGNFFGPGFDRNVFEARYRAMPVSFIDKNAAENGDKVILPPSALDRLGACTTSRS